MFIGHCAYILVTEVEEDIVAMKERSPLKRRGGQIGTGLIY